MTDTIALAAARFYRQVALLAREPMKVAVRQAKLLRCAADFRAILLENGVDPEIPWITGLGDFAKDHFPPVLHVDWEEDPNDSAGGFLWAREDGIAGLDDGKAVAIYRIEKVGTVKVTTEIINERSTP